MKREDFESDEEWHVWNWLNEAYFKGLVNGIVYQPGPFELSPRESVKVLKKLKTKTRVIDKFLFNPHVYTPDFAFTVVSDALECVFKHPNTGTYGHKVLIDTKGCFGMRGDHRSFSINQKWMWQKFQIYVEKIIPEVLFKKTWCPDVCRFSPKLCKPVKKYIGVPTIDDFIAKEV